MFAPNYFGSSYFAGSYWPPAGVGTPITWENSNILTRVTRGTQLTTAALPPGNWRLLIKAFDTSGNESLNEAFTEIEVINGNDIIVDNTSEPRWSGTLTDFVKHDVSGLLVPSSVLAAPDMTVAEMFTQFVPFIVDESIYETIEIDLGFDSLIRIYAEMEGVLGQGEAGVSDPILAIDYRVDAGIYDGFRDWTVGVVSARYVKAQVKIVSATGKASLKSVRTILDVEERIEGGKSVVIAGGGTTITFASPFHLVPRVDVTADSATALIATKETPTTTSFIAHVFNTSGSDVGGTIDWSAEGA